MARRIVFTILVLSLFSLVGCKKTVEEEIVQPNVPVKVIEIIEQSRSIELIYTGVVVPEDVINYSFKSTGRIKSVNVQSGDNITKGDILATLDSTDLDLQVDALKAQATAAYGDVKKARESFNYASSQLSKTKVLFDSGSVSQDTLDQVQLNYDIADNTLKQAQQSYNSVKANQKITENLVLDTNLIAQSSGTVLSVNYEIGELVGAAQAVVTLRSKAKTVNVGLSQKDADIVTKDTPVCINYNGKKIEGEISQLDAMPERATRTYLVKVRSESEDLKLGRLTEVCFQLGQKEGIWIPIQSILSEGEKFVYVIKDGRAFKRSVEVINISGFQAEVRGLDSGEQMVVSGMKSLSDGVSIEIVK
ncbi:MAG: efflux RND transporter periplasmic adaptor subunit [Firmicutes bacterium]|jgi:RND family efflux transporter MFP subunit|nr:efflux RND transporter periplasmic adaptor subunit [Bacillota bacterium]